MEVGRDQETTVVNLYDLLSVLPDFIRTCTHTHTHTHTFLVFKTKKFKFATGFVIAIHVSFHSQTMNCVYGLTDMPTTMKVKQRTSYYSAKTQ